MSKDITLARIATQYPCIANTHIMHCIITKYYTSKEKKSTHVKTKGTCFGFENTSRLPTWLGKFWAFEHSTQNLINLTRNSNDSAWALILDSSSRVLRIEDQVELFKFGVTVNSTVNTHKTYWEQKLRIYGYSITCIHESELITNEMDRAKLVRVPL